MRTHEQLAREQASRTRLGLHDSIMALSGGGGPNGANEEAAGEQEHADVELRFDSVLDATDPCAVWR